MQADDLMAAVFPDAAACLENIPGDREIPDHPLVKQTLDDCLTAAMDVDGLVEVLKRIEAGEIEVICRELTSPSPLAQEILGAKPYAFLDDAPAEERRTLAVQARRYMTPEQAAELGKLDPEAIARVREEAWPQPESAEEVHEALLWIGYVTGEEARPWAGWLDELRAAGRVVREGDRWFAAEASREPLAVLRGRMEALGPVVSDDPMMLDLEREGTVLRTRFDGKPGWCHRRLLARIHRYTLERLRSEIAPVSAAEFLRFLAAWQHVDEEHRLEGPLGVSEVVRQLAGFEVPAAAWEASVLPARVRGYRREWLDQVTLAGEVAWGRLWGGGASAIRTTPLCLVLREDLELWTALAGPPERERLSAAAATIHDALAARGALFPQELARAARLLPSQVELGLAELIAAGMITCDSYSGLRQLLVPPSRRRRPVTTVGRWSFFRREAGEAAAAPDAEAVARQLLRRTGVVFRMTLGREKLPVPWRDLARVYRRLELKGEVRGGRFVARFSGEQYALPEAVELLRAVRRRGETQPVTVAAADPLNFQGILTPDERVSPQTRRRVAVG
jgi:ATP-dependent Lhr-like helicase